MRHKGCWGWRNRDHARFLFPPSSAHEPAVLIDVRIICAYDALKIGQQFQRWLAAEGHQVEVNCGRPSLAYLETSRAREEAVIVIWSEHAQNAFYPLQWAQGTEPARLIELA